MGSLGGIPETVLGILFLIALAVVILSLVIAGPAHAFAVGAATVAGWSIPDFKATLLFVGCAVVFVGFVSIQ